MSKTDAKTLVDLESSKNGVVDIVERKACPPHDIRSALRTRYSATRKSQRATLKTSRHERSPGDNRNATKPFDISLTVPNTSNMNAFDALADGLDVAFEGDELIPRGPSYLERAMKIACLLFESMDLFKPAVTSLRALAEAAWVAKRPSEEASQGECQSSWVLKVADLSIDDHLKQLRYTADQEFNGNNPVARLNFIAIFLLCVELLTAFDGPWSVALDSILARRMVGRTIKFL
ncbi:hypothetical protein PSPO01_08627 [Paraphaeosphaeria sporulosa]